MYSNLIQEDIMTLDNEFFKIDTMFETVDKMYDIKMKELEYNYIYTESINATYTDLYTEAEAAKGEKEQGLLGRLFTAILNFIRKIRAKILRFFGNDKKAAELEAKIKGNPELANQTVEITNTTDAEKAIDEGTSFFGSLIDKIVKGTATEKDADEAEEKNKSLLSRIAIFGGGALLAAGGAKVTSDKLKERGVTKQTIKEAVSNLFKREEDTKKKSNEVTQTNEQNVQKAQQAINNNSKSGNEENTKAGRRIVASFKDFITGAGKFFTGKASEIRSKINGVSSDEQQTSEKTNKNTKKITDVDSYYKTKIEYKDQEEFFKLKDENNKIIKEIRDKDNHYSKELWEEVTQYIMVYESEFNGTPLTKKLPSMTLKKIKSYNKKLKEYKDKVNEDYNKTTQSKTNTTGPLKTQKNEQDKPEDKAEKQSETSASKEQIKNTNTQQANDKQNQKNDNKQWNQSIDYRKDFAERLLKHESIDTVPTMKTELERIIKNGKYTDEEYKRMGEIEDRLQFEMILQKVYDDRDKLNSNDQKILDTLIKKTNITANDDKELTILLNKVQYVKYNKKKRNKSDEQQTNENQKNKNDSENNTEIDDKPVKVQVRRVSKKQSMKDQDDELKDNLNETKDTLDHKIQHIMNRLRAEIEGTSEASTISTKLDQTKRGYTIFSIDEVKKMNFNTNDDEYKGKSMLEKAELFLKKYELYSKYKNVDKDKIKKLLGPDYEDELDNEMEEIKEKFEKCDDGIETLKELIEKRKTFKESSYDLINDIKTIFENSFNKGERNMDNTKVLNFIDELEQERRNEVDNNRLKDSISYKYNCLNKAKKDGVEECLSKSFEKFYLDAIPLNDEYKTANHDDLCNDVHDFIKKQGAKSMTYYVGEARKKSPVMKKLYESVEKLVDDKFKEKEEKINETKPELDLVFKMDGETEKKIDVINQDLELDDIAKVISDNVRNTAMSEINRAKEEKENMKQIETDLANDINVKSEAAIERELSLRGINQKAVFQPSLFEGIMIGKMNKLSYTTESTDDVYLYNAMKDYTGAFYDGGDSATPEEIAFVESVRELTLLSMERALKIKKYSLQDIKNLANEYASMK